MNAFERHGIDHLSASSLNTARSSLAYWLVHYRAQVKEPSSISMIAGQTSETAVSMGLFDPSIPVDKCVELAKIDYMRETAIGNYDPDDRHSKLEDIIGRAAEGRKKAFNGFVRNAIAALRPYGLPTPPEQGSKQHRIEIMLDGIASEFRAILWLCRCPLDHGMMHLDDTIIDYGCCPMCKDILQKDASKRSAKDPVSGNAVDKSSAVIGTDAHGMVYYFENKENFNKYASGPMPEMNHEHMEGMDMEGMDMKGMKDHGQ